MRKHSVFNYVLTWKWDHILANIYICPLILNIALPKVAPCRHDSPGAVSSCSATALDGTLVLVRPPSTGIKNIAFIVSPLGDSESVSPADDALGGSSVGVSRERE